MNKSFLFGFISMLIVISFSSSSQADMGFWFGPSAPFQVRSLTGLNNPSAPAIDLTNNLFFVVSLGSQIVFSFDLSNFKSKSLSSISYSIPTPTPTSVPARLDEIRLDSTYVYFLDRTNKRLSLFLRNHEQPWAFISGIAFDLSSLSNVLGSFAVANGKIYFSDQANHRVYEMIVDYGSGSCTWRWIGWVNTVFTGAQACSSGLIPTAGQSTPGWCPIDGNVTSTFTTRDGGFDKPSGLAVDPTGQFLLVVDSGNHRIQKFNLTTGTFVGWTGGITSTTSPSAMVNTDPRTDGVDCSNSVAGSSTPGWCVGGAAGNGATNGFFKNPYAVAFDGSGNFYVSDSDNYRVSRFNSNGTFTGWAGKIDPAFAQATGGSTGCKGLSGSFTPGWCLGGQGVKADATPTPAPLFADKPQNLTMDDRGVLWISIPNLGQLSFFHAQGH